MDRLLNISRQGGFPWCAETAEAVNNNARYIEAVMDGFGIGQRQAILLHKDSIIYLKETTNQRGKIVTTTTQIPAYIGTITSGLVANKDYPSRENLLENPNKYTLIDRSVKINISKENSDTEKYEDCILNESYEIALVDSSNPGWTFFEMSDFFEKERWITIPNNEIVISSFLVGGSVPEVTIDSTSIVRYNKLKTKLEVQLKLRHSTNHHAALLLNIPTKYAEDMEFPDTITFPLMSTPFSLNLTGYRDAFISRIGNNFRMFLSNADWNGNIFGNVVDTFSGSVILK
jgi:hypothetical protein